MPVNVIILVVIGLIILVILVIMLSGKTKTLDQNTSACVSAGGTCKTICDSTEKSVDGITCPTTTPFCCRYDYAGTS